MKLREVGNSVNSGKQKPRKKTPVAKLHEAPSRSWDARNLHLPTLTIIGLIGFCCWGTWALVTQKGDVDKRIDSVATAVEQLAISVKNLIPAIARQDGWTGKDQMIWCLKAQQKNPSWTCPDYAPGVGTDEKTQSMNIQVEKERLETLLNKHE